MECRCRPPYLETLRSLASVNRGAFVAMAGSLVAASSVRAAAATAGAADAILINGRFRTMAAASVVDAVAITGGRFSAIGSRTHVMTYRGPQTEVVDLRGATVLPGFVEPHMHFIYQIVIANLLVARYPQCASLDAFLAALRGGLASVPAGDWYGAFGFDNSVMTPYRQLTIQDLDSVSTDVPIFVINPSGHIGYANGKAFTILGITAQSPDVPGGGRYGKDAAGALNGVIYEPPAMAPFIEKLLSSVSPTPEKIAGWYAGLLETAAKAGVTTVHDAGIGPTGKVPDDWAIYTALVSRANNPVRISTMPDFQEHATFDDVVAKIPRRPGAPIFLADGRLSVPCVKFWADGSLQGFTGALTQPYLGKPNDKGSLNWEPGPLNELVALAKKNGWSAAIHANGDAGLDLALGALSSAYGSTAVPGFRNRIEHCTVTRPEQWDALQTMNLAVSFTEGHVYEWGLPFAQRILGEPRAEGIDNAPEAIRRNLVWSMNSDYATTDIHPLRYIQTAVTRTPLGATSPLGPDLRVSVDQALRAMTINGAIACQLEDRVGSIELGKDADLVELAADPATVDVSSIASIPVVATWSRGMRFVHAS
ncbi:MAG TPA: amidohydrolase [Candidatus Acidoferrum sp.]|jgi:predicted amidohydrolase YtcJ|nr:amidohydrolase [Candidatus Acidoferrum sp.]